MQEENKLAVYIFGPDNEDNYEKTSNFFKGKFRNFITIGNGEDDIADENGEGISLNIGNQDQEDILVYVQMHGKSDVNGHVLLINKDGTLYPSKKLFEILANNIIKPIDMIFNACNGKAASADLHLLPIGSRVIIFSDSDKNTAVAAIDNTLDSLSDHKFTLDNFYNNYFANMFLMDESPTMYVIGGQIIDPVPLSKIYLGKHVNQGSRQYIHEHFGQSVCKDDIVCHAKIDHLISKIQRSSSIDEFRITSSENYRVAISEWLQMQAEYEFSRNLKHKQDAKYNDQKSEFCYIEIIELKDKADQLLLKYQIPLSLDLSDQSWYKIEYNYDTDEEGFERLNDIGIYSFIRDDGFVENNNFAKPLHADYGFVLGVIKDIHLSLTSDF